MKDDAVLAAGEEAVRRVSDERGLVDRPAVLSEFLRGPADARRAELGQPNLQRRLDGCKRLCGEYDDFASLT